MDTSSSAIKIRTDIPSPPKKAGIALHQVEFPSVVSIWTPVKSATRPLDPSIQVSR